MFTNILFLAAAFLMAGVADARLETRLSSSELRGVAAVIEEARRDELPVEPLVQKALEGKIKGAPGERITAAVAALLERMRLARAVFGVEAEEDELTAGAAALYAGVDTLTLGALRRLAGESSKAVELIVLADLIERGVPAPEASDLILSLARAGVDDRELLALREHVERDIRDGVTPVSAAMTRARGLVAPSEAGMPGVGP